MHDYHNMDDLEAISEQLKQIIKDYYINPASRPVLNYQSKAEISALFYREQAPENPKPLSEVVSFFQDSLLPLSVKTWHPRFLNQMFAGASFPAIIGDFLASMMNPTLATWEMSPVATLIEKNVAHWMAQVIGLPEGSGGIFLPGGTLSNLLALAIARNERLGEGIKQDGLQGMDQGWIICSEASHYSIAGAANLLGIGQDHIIKLPVNRRQEMDPDALRECLSDCQRKGIRVFAAVATTGITVTGGFDPLSEIASILEQENIHLHVDAAFGGGLAFSDRGPRFFDGIARADSVTWDAHKWMHTPLTCSVLLVPNPGVLEKTFSQKADYLFHPQEDDLLADLGKSTILCGKRFDALKIWLLWNTFGTRYFSDLANDRLALMDQLNEIIDGDDEFHSDYRMVSPILCFRYQTDAINRLSEPERTIYTNRLHRSVRETISRSGYALFNITKLNGADQFRIVFINPLTQQEHIVELLERTRQACRAYVKNNPPE